MVSDVEMEINHIHTQAYVRFDDQPRCIATDRPNNWRRYYTTICPLEFLLVSVFVMCLCVSYVRVCMAHVCVMIIILVRLMYAMMVGF